MIGWPKCALAVAAALCAASAAAADPARESAPAGGWAAEAGGTRGGAQATAEHVYTVRNRAELLSALARAARHPSIIQVAGLIDMSEGRPFASSREQHARGMVPLPSDTTLIGSAPGAGFINASLLVQNASQVIIRNLSIRNPCDVGPVWDPDDAPKGNWNSLFDGITVSGSDHVWIDHNSFTDAPDTDDKSPVEDGMLKQCHDGALDITKGSDYLTVSYNRFAEHEKNTLIGSGDRQAGDEGHLRVTLAHNLFEHVHERAPRVRFGRVHVYNNYYAGERQRAVYRHAYSIGVGKEAKILSHNNAFDIAGATQCVEVVRTPAPTSPAGRFSDSGSLLNGKPLGSCPFSAEVGWSVPYAYTALPADAVKADVLAHAGAGKLGAAGPLALFDAPATPDYYVEGRFQVQPQAGQAYLVARYVDAQNWYGAGLDVAGGKGKVKIEIVRMQDGVLTRLKQVARNVPVAGRWHTLRYELAGPNMVVYLNGERVTFAADSAFAKAGRAGVYRSDEASSVALLRTGDAAHKPARLALALSGNSIHAQAGDAPLTVPVSALLGDGSTFAFTAASSDPAVATVAVKDGALVVTPVAPGQASLALTSTQDAAVEALVALQVAAPFAVPAAPVALKQAVQPLGAPVPADTLLSIAFDQAPVLGQSGSVRIYRARDHALADSLPVGEDNDVLGYAGQDIRRAVRYRPIWVQGNKVMIKPHTARLAADTEYVVEVGKGTLQGMLNGKPFEGIGSASRWQFRTAPAPRVANSLTVDEDGPADFRTVQGAINHAMAVGTKAAPVTITVKNGDYREMLYIRAKDNLTIRGESRDGVVIHATNNEAINPGSGAGQAAGSPAANGGRALLLIEAADLLTLDTLTLRNDTLRSAAQSGQAETLVFNEEAGRLVAKNASFFSEQDTIQVKGYAWFYNTLVAGNVDYVWGANRVALFENSELRSVGDSANPSGGGYVVQARTVDADDKGFVFWRSKLTHGPGPAGNDVPPGTTYLARSPGTASTWDNVSFIDCAMDVHVAPVGWAGKGVNREPAQHPLAGTATRGWREYGTRDLAGKPLDLSKRVNGYLMSAAEVAAQFGSRAAIFAAFNGGRGWNPQN